MKWKQDEADLCRVVDRTGRTVCVAFNDRLAAKIVADHRKYQEENMGNSYDQARYHAAAHGMQSGVATIQNYEPAETTPKHLRVGVNAAMCDHAGLVRLLIAKGLITSEEHAVAIADEMERERDRYAHRIEEATGARPDSVNLA